MGLKSAKRPPHLFNKEVTVLFPGKSVLEICTFFLYLFYCRSENENVYKQVTHEIPHIGGITESFESSYLNSSQLRRLT